MKFIFAYLFLVICALGSNALITIEIEPSDIHQLSEILQNYIEHQNIPVVRKQSILPMKKKISVGIFQMMGILFTLVGANLLTTKLDPIVIASNAIYNNSTFIPSEMCKYDFGCDDNVCWRTCEKAVNNISHMNSWCYTTSPGEKPSFQKCIHSYECSPCWDCLGPCHSKAPWFVRKKNIIHHGFIFFILYVILFFIDAEKLKENPSRSEAAYTQ